MAFSLADCRHIVVEGPIGVGKSSLARKLASHLQADLLLEKPEENPFLARFYSDGSRYAFQTQMYFLFQRVEQYRELSQPGIFSNVVVSDFFFAKDALFAELTLSDEEFRLYAQMHQHLAPQVPSADLVIWLRADPPVLMERIRKRGLLMEQDIDEAYLQRLCDAYEKHFAGQRATASPGVMLSIDTEGFNPVDDEQAFQRLLDRLSRLQDRYEHFVPRAEAVF